MNFIPAKYDDPLHMTLRSLTQIIYLRLYDGITGKKNVFDIVLKEVPLPETDEIIILFFDVCYESALAEFNFEGAKRRYHLKKPIKRQIESGNQNKNDIKQGVLDDMKKSGIDLTKSAIEVFSKDFNSVYDEIITINTSSNKKKLDS